MKKIFILTLVAFISTATFAQKSDFFKYKKMIAAKIAANIKQNDARAAYLMDSTKIFDVDIAGDSTLFLSSKFQYLSDGRVDKNETYVDFSGFFTFYIRANSFYDKTKTNLLSYQDTYLSNDGVSYDKVSVDSFYYDSKDRLVLNRTLDANDLTSVTNYETRFYKTAFATADTIRTYEQDQNTGSLILSSIEFNTLDSKGNTLTQVLGEYDSNLETFNFTERRTNTYNAKNLVEVTALDTWNSDDEVWEKYDLFTNKYNAKNQLETTIDLWDWDATANIWNEKDSISYSYTTAGKVKEKQTHYYYDGEYFIYNSDVNAYDTNNNLVRVENFSDNNDEFEFRLASITKNWWSFYKDAVSAKDIFSDDFKLVVANPITNQQALTVNSKIDGTYQLLAFDSNGRMVSKQTINNNETVMTNLPMVGQYVYLLTDKNNKPLAMKKVVKQ